LRIARSDAAIAKARRRDAVTAAHDLAGRLGTTLDELPRDAVYRCNGERPLAVFRCADLPPTTAGNWGFGGRLLSHPAAPARSRRPPQWLVRRSRGPRARAAQLRAGRRAIRPLSSHTRACARETPEPHLRPAEARDQTASQRRNARSPIGPTTWSSCGTRSPRVVVPDDVRRGPGDVVGLPRLDRGPKYDASTDYRVCADRRGLPGRRRGRWLARAALRTECCWHRAMPFVPLGNERAQQEGKRCSARRYDLSVRPSRGTDSPGATPAPISASRFRDSGLGRARHRPRSPNQYPRPPAAWRTMRRWWQSGLG
jgi:hypothetical protein